MLLFHDEIMREIVTNRQAWIKGWTGAHKTSLSYRLAYELIKRKEVKYLISNNKCVWADEIEGIKEDKLNSVIILDEGGLYVETKQDVREFVSLAMKLNVIYLIPSYWEVPRGMRNLIIEPAVNIIDSGIPLLIYKWTVKSSSGHDHGYFGWFNPSEVYGVYSRQDPGENTTRIIEGIREKTKELYKRYGHDEPSKMAIDWWEVKDKIEEELDKKY